MRRAVWLALELIVLVAALAGAQGLIQHEQGTHWFPDRIRIGPVTFAQLGTGTVLANDGTAAYCSDCQATCPATGGGSGRWCVHEAGQWDCCMAAITGLCPAGQCATGIDPTSGAPVCTPCGCSAPGGCNPVTCPPGQVLTAVTDSCQFTCTPLINVCCSAGLSCCSTTTSTTTTTTTLLTSTSTTSAPTTTTSTTLPFTPSTTFLVVPDYPTSERAYSPTPGFQILSVEGVDVMYCWRFMAPPPGIANAAKIATIAQTGSPFASIEVGIYPDADGGAALGRAHSAAMVLTGDGVPHVVKDTSLVEGTFSLSAGTMYRVCLCGQLQNQIAYASSNVVASNGFPLEVNKFVASAGVAANVCGAIPPSTTGAITANPAKVPPIVLLSVE